jgi:riboflavin synthase
VLTIQADKVLTDTQIGDSLSVNGVCLTITTLGVREFTVDVMAETLRNTSLVRLKTGSKVNLERALQLQTRLGGHIVSGHVDATGVIKQISREGIAQIFEISLPAELQPLILPKGSIAIDGISLTVARVLTQSFTISLIPHTAAETTLGFKTAGHIVNLETDLIGKYVANLLKHPPPASSLTWEFLGQNGYI